MGSAFRSENVTRPRGADSFEKPAPRVGNDSEKTPLSVPLAFENRQRAPVAPIPRFHRCFRPILRAIPRDSAQEAGGTSIPKHNAPAVLNHWGAMTSTVSSGRSRIRTYDLTDVNRAL